jgi:hypothetical protein
VKAALAAKQRFEEVAEAASLIRRRRIVAGRLPARWRRELAIAAARALGAQLVVFAPLVVALQYFIGFRYFLELLLGVLFLADVRMVTAGLPFIGLLDFFGRGRRLDPEQLVVVFELHTLICIG